MKKLTEIAILLIYSDGYIESQNLTHEFLYHGKYIYELWKTSSRFKKIIKKYNENSKEYIDIVNTLTSCGIAILINNAIKDEYIDWINNGIVPNYRIYLPSQFYSVKQLLLVENIFNKYNDSGFLIKSRNSQKFETYSYKKMLKHIEEEKNRLGISNADNNINNQSFKRLRKLIKSLKKINILL